MAATKHFLTYEEKTIRLYGLDTGETAVVAADIPTGRTPAFTYQVLTNNPTVKPYAQTYPIQSPTNHGSRPGQILTTEGVRVFLTFLRDSRTQQRNVKANEKATQWIEKVLLPKMEEITPTRVGLPMKTRVGLPMSTRVGKPRGGVAIQIGKVTFNGEFQDLIVDTVRVTCNGRSKTWTAHQLFEALGLIPS
jgi:hypothetical protein